MLKNQIFISIIYLKCIVEFPLQKEFIADDLMRAMVFL